MRTISAEKIKETVRDLCVKANLELRPDVLCLLKDAHARETQARAKEILGAIIKNAQIAKREKLAICQDTGLPTVFVELGQDVKVSGDLKTAIQKGVEAGYRKAALRNSIVKDPLARGVAGFSPAVIHMDIVKGSRLRLTVLPKGFGCENKTQLKMFLPTEKLDEIKKFIIEAVRSAGPDACPPYVVGVGIGGTADYAMLLAKKALLKKVTRTQGHKDTSKIKIFEQEIGKEINRLNIGPMGLGGRTTCLAVNIETYPTHIAGLPVAVSISCHALRSAGAVI
jgi:fumarate hydratase subunit alpha